MADMVAILIFISLLVFFYMGTYVLALNNQSILNRAFFGLSMAAAYWSFTFSVANIADSYEMALFWRRASTVGWGLFFSLQLDFTLVLTSKSYLMKNKWLYALIYTPALINLWVFGIYSPVAISQYNLLQGEFGWFHVTENTLWEIYFRFYYITFVLITIALFIRWGHKQVNLHMRKKGYLISGSILVGLILGSLTNYFLNDQFSVTIPQLEPVFIMIPMLIMFFSVDDFGLKLDSKYDQTFQKGKYLSKETHEKLLILISKIYMITAYIIFGFRYFINHDAVEKILPITCTSFAIGAVIIILMSVNRLSYKVDAILKIILIVSIPLISWLQFDILGTFGFATPVIMILLSVTFNDRKLTRNIMIISVVTLLVVWVAKPIFTFEFDNTDHAGRILIFVIIGYIGLFINKIYSQRINHIEKQIEADIFFREAVFMMSELDDSSMNLQIERILEHSCLYSKSDGAIIVFNKSFNNTFYCFYEPNHSIESVNAIEMALKSLLNHDNETMSVQDFEEKVKANALLDSLKTQIVIKYILENGRVKGLLVLFNNYKALMLSAIEKSAIAYFTDRLSTAIMKMYVDEKVRHLIYEDGITGLSTRHALNEYMDQLIRLKKDFAFVLISVDNLSVVNDSLGYKQGDILLKEFGDHIEQSIDVDHFSARFFSGIFAVVLPNHLEEERIRNIIFDLILAAKKSQKFTLMPTGINLSVGVSICQSALCEMCTYDMIQQRADLALSYSDGQNGSIVFYDDALNNSFLESLNLEADLEKAISENQFVLYYQPKVNVITKKIIGVEALIRWNHPTKGLIPPLQFLPIAEKNGLIKQIDLWVLKQACNQNHMWQDMGLPMLKMAVNFTPISLMDQKTVQRLLEHVKNSNCNSHSLEIEITETTSFYLGEPVIEILAEIRKMGINIALDDFGIEYSSLSRLHHLPIDHLKIDKIFIDDAVINERSEKVLANIIRLGLDLGLELTAEGVETEAQVSILRQLGCSQAQGYYFYKPMPAKEIEAILRTEPISRRKLTAFHEKIMCDT